MYIHWIICSELDQEIRKCNKNTLETDIIRLIITFKMIFIGLQDAPTNVPSDPKGLQLVLEYLKETYGNPPICVQENGKHNSQLEASKPFVTNKLVQAIMWPILHLFRYGICRRQSG
jgi:hypothetical protein